MELIENARSVLLKAWSVRFAVASTVLTVAGVLTDSLPYLQAFIPDNITKILAAACGLAAVVARVVKQPELQREAQNESL